MSITDNSYDALPYAARPRYATHPDALAVNGQLAGLSTQSIDRCRVLEVGCGTGGNLIPMAATLPQSQFVGIDLSPVQIDIARAETEALGLKNLRFDAQSLMELDPALGQFDYIISHGVYSWVPPDVQDGLMKLYRNRLNPSGVGYISYNTYPGWHFRDIVRQMMLDHIAGHNAEPARAVRAAREYIRFLAAAVPDPDSPFGQVLQAEAKLILHESDHYVFHEYLEANNRPVLFREFAAHAGQHDLKYIGEVPPFLFVAGLPEDTVNLLHGVSNDRIDLEQHVDFLRNRTFRRSLLCHADAVMYQRTPTEAVLGLQASANSRPVVPDAKADPDAAQVFTTRDGNSMSTRNPIVTGALRALFAAWPAAVPVIELEQRVANRIGSSWSNDPDRARRILHQVLIEQHFYGMLTLNMKVPAFATRPPILPVGFAPARRAATSKSAVPTIRHFEEVLGPIERFVLTQLDGKHDRTALATSLASAIAAGSVSSQPEGDPAVWVDQALNRLASVTLIEAD